jgi:hypothetical protein
MFQCALMSVDDAIAQGVYAPVDMAAHRDMLNAVFPEGVCDYTLGDQGRPADLPVSAWNHHQQAPNTSKEKR